MSEKKEDIEDNIKKYQNLEKIASTFELSKARVEEENRYLGLNGKDIELYQK